MPTTLDLTGLDRLQARLLRIANPDATPLMKMWMRIIADDNRRGVLAGLDKHGNPLIPVTYRPKGPKSTHVKPSRKKGAYNAGIGGNLTSSQYRKLTGPPLAPRGQQSRVITNLLTDFTPASIANRNGRWEAWGYWDEVVSRKGVPFLKYHFDGATLKHGFLPQRDLRGLRPQGIEKARLAMRAWAVDQVRTYG